MFPPSAARSGPLLCYRRFLILYPGMNRKAEPEFLNFRTLNLTCIFIIGLSCLLPFLPGMQTTMAQHSAEQTESLQARDSTISLGLVTVESFRLSTHLITFPGNLAVLKGEELKLADATNLATTLNTIPGVSMQSGTYATNRIVIRGMGSRTPYNTNRIRSYLNDIPLTSSDGVSTPEELDLLSLGRIEVIRGPSSALYGSGLGGSISLFTPELLEREGKFNFNYGGFNTLRTSVSGATQADGASFWGSLSHLQSEGYRSNNETRRTSFLSTARWKKSKWLLKSTLMLNDVKAGIPSSLGETQFRNDPRAAATSWEAIKAYKKYTKALAGVTLTNIPTSKLSNQLTIHGKWGDSFERRPFNDLSDQAMSIGIRNRLTYFRPLSDWIFGIDWTSEQYAWKLEKDNLLLNENRENRHQLSVFGIVNYRPSPALSFSVAGTLNHILYKLSDLFSTNGNQSGRRIFPLIVSPRAGVNYTVNQHLRLYASAGHGFSMPSPEETLLPAGEVNPAIKPEQGMQYEAGSRFNLFSKSSEAELTLYWIELSNLLVTKRISEDIFTGMNAGKTRHQGIELLLHHRLLDFSDFPGMLRSTLSYTFSRNRFTAFTDDGKTFDGNHLPGIPDQTARLLLSWKPVETLEISAHIQYTGKQFLDDANTLRYGSYTLLNLKGSWLRQVRKAGNLVFSAGANNLTNTAYASMLVVNAMGLGGSEARYYYPGLPLHVYAGIEFRF